MTLYPKNQLIAFRKVQNKSGIIFRFTFYYRNDETPFFLPLSTREREKEREGDEKVDNPGDCSVLSSTTIKERASKSGFIPPSSCKTTRERSRVSATERKLRNYEKRLSLNGSTLGETFVIRNNNGVSRAPDYFEITRYMTLIERLPVGVALMENRFSDFSCPSVTRGRNSLVPDRFPFSRKLPS